MTIRQQFVLSLDTDKRFNSPTFAHSFLSSWLNHSREQLRPERWGRGEPVRNELATTHFDELVSEWCSVALMFSRVSPPKMTVSFDWRERKGLDPRPYPWGVDAWISRNASAELLRAFLEFLITSFEPAFASLTTTLDSQAKHFITGPHFVNGRHVGTAEWYEGHHVLDTIPGVYWMTYFGRSLIERFGAERLKTLSVGKLKKISDGYLLLAYDDPGIIGTQESRSIEERIIDHIGSAKFFNKKAKIIEYGPTSL